MLKMLKMLKNVKNVKKYKNDKKLKDIIIFLTFYLEDAKTFTFLAVTSSFGTRAFFASSFLLSCASFDFFTSSDSFCSPCSCSMLHN